ncbi:Hexosaminidase D-like Protein [Tribolium castaneum]|uniref:beta-N-acetylhexosaminidase n=1 Tax=Tribolium castaneum TaxID=7070 RepID=D6X2G1_TRICA|nr:PREDICTED: hexosaminidase D [Tribolium castaneum]EFA10268.1 Hexosaminidase D-like Protein [Tribolium castaneum]|eukprot:XP_967097.1 PREDICTED: hexosaminidase D [Tribolium castaneum]
MKKLHWFNVSSIGKPLKLFVTFALILTVLFITYFTYLKPKPSPTKVPFQHRIFDEYKHMSHQETPFKGAKIVHLDLKGAPPKISYYKTLFSLLSKFGATGVLIEYEDMFPYNSPLLKNVSALNAYTVEDIHYINKLALENKLEVIPLLQTFGHLEFLLKLEEFSELREVPEYPQVICPTHEKTLSVLMEMIDQVLQMHPHSKIIHIGADEVYYLGFCDRCANIMNKFNLSKNMLFLEHINAITTRIRKKHPHLRILMWDDEFRSFSVKELKSGFLDKGVQPVVWKYSKDVYEELGPSLWEMYSEVFPKVWIASAFKGATGSNQYVSDVTHYVQNHRSWLSLMSEYSHRITFEGIIITGWQRYDHFAVLCELLPVSLPSLAMSLRVIRGYQDSPLSPPTEVAKLLGCEQPYALIGPVFGSPKCSYTGGDILEGALKLQQLKQEYETILEDSRVKGWMSDYNKNHQFSNPQHVQSVTAPLNRIKGELMQLDGEMTAAMYEVYDNYTVSEWRETYIKPFEREVRAMVDARDKILAKNYWPRRPLLQDGDEL